YGDLGLKSPSSPETQSIPGEPKDVRSEATPVRPASKEPLQFEPSAASGILSASTSGESSPASSTAPRPLFLSKGLLTPWLEEQGLCRSSSSVLRNPEGLSRHRRPCVMSRAPRDQVM